MPVLIRPARAADAAEGAALLRASITELCHLDHQADPARLARWLRNKTEASWLTWRARSDARMLVAVDAESRLLGVGMVDFAGTILLNYVAPQARFRGVSKAMIAALEAEIRALGGRVSRLETTLTAERFYLGLGYRPIAAGTKPERPGNWLEKPLS